MSLPSLEQNGVFTHVYPIDDLGFTDTSDTIVLGNNATANSTVFSTGVGATVVILVELSAGSGNLNVCTGASGFTPNYGSPTSTLALSGTAMEVLVQDTTFGFSGDTGLTSLSISPDTRFVGIQLAAGAGGMTVSKMAVLVLYELTAGEDWFTSVRAGANAVINTTLGDGSGRVFLGPGNVGYNPYINANVKL